MSSLTNSSMKPARKQTFQPLQGQSGIQSIRTSLQPQNSLSKAAGVSHLSEKNNFGVNTFTNLQRQQLQSSSAYSKRKDSKINTNDYYTVQNTKNTNSQTSANNHNVNAQQSTLIPSRNNNLNQQKDNVSANRALNQDQKQQQNQIKMKSPLRQSSNNFGGQVLDEVQEKGGNYNNNAVSGAGEELQSKVYLNSQQQQLKSNLNSSTSRHSIITDKKIQRALSQVKTNGILNNFTQATNFNKSYKSKNYNINTTQATSSHPYTDRNNSTTVHKKSLIIRNNNKDRNSPKNGINNLNLNNNNSSKSQNKKSSIFRSPQQLKKVNTQVNESTASNGPINSNTNSPLPISNQRIQHSQTSKIVQDFKCNSNNTQDQQKPSSKKLQNSKNQQNKQNNQLQSPIISIPFNQLANNGAPSCLQIDLSSLSNNKDDETNLAYGVTFTQNIQPNFPLSQNNKKNQQFKQSQQSSQQIQQKPRKQTSISQTKKKALNLMAQSPNILQTQTLPNKSPKTFRQNTANNSSNNNAITRHSVQPIKNQSKNNQEQAAAKIIENAFKNQKNQTQKLSKTSNAQTLVQTINAPSSFDKKYSMDLVMKSTEEIINNQNKKSISEVIQDNNNTFDNHITFQEQVENFSFNSKNNKSICDQPIEIIAIQTNLQIENNQQFMHPIKSNSQIQIPLANQQSQSLLKEPSNSSLIKVISQKSLQENNHIKKNSVISVSSQKQTAQLFVDDEESIKSNAQPISKSQFIEKFGDRLFQFEINELNELKNDEIFFISDQIQQRLPQNIQKSKNTFVEREFQKSLDDEEGYYNVLIGDHLMYRYEILKILGKGSFAQVVSCIDHKTQQRVAIKVTRNTEIDHKFANCESKLLNFLMEKDPNDSHNVVRLIDEFYFRDHHCFVFELLYTDLFEHLKDNGFIGFELEKIRDYAIQILEALIFLEDHNIIHCDLKPENILLRDEKAETLKLVDYGSGCFRDEQVYTYVQSRFYRAPEVILRIPYSEKVDIWSFGCILAELYTGEPLFPGNNEQEQIELIMEICGIPPENMIDKSRKKDHYFDVDYSPYLIEDDKMGILRIPESRRLEDAIPSQDVLFLDFLRKCLELDPEQRISAKQAIQHQWIQDAIEKKKLQEEQQQTIVPVNKISRNNSTQTMIQIPSQQQLQIPNMARRREEEQDGVKGNVYEESPVRILQDDKPKKSLNKHINFQTIKVIGPLDVDSSMSTPGKEGGISSDSKLQQETLLNFKQILKKEQSVSQNDLSKTSSNPNSGQRKQEKQKSKGVKMIGKFEIVRQEEQELVVSRSGGNVADLGGGGGMGDGDTNSRTSGIASEANIPPVNQHDLINHENTINKITITFYQKRTHKK